MNGTTLEKAKKIIDNRRHFAEHEAFENKIEAMKDDKFKELYSRYINQIIDEAKSQVTKSKALPLKQAYEKRLTELNIGQVEPQYFCKKCNDKGLTENGYCDCLIDELNKILKKESGFLGLEEFKSVNFDIFANKDYFTKLYKTMERWCNSEFDKSLIYIAGNTGVGKTHLIKCMANELIKRHKLVLLTSSFAMHQDFARSYACRNEVEKQNIISKYLDADVLFIDDLGTEIRQPNITVNYLYLVLNERKMKKMPTIITSNLDMADIADYYDERISSRIIDKASSICVFIEGEDLRLKNNI